MNLVIGHHPHVPQGVEVHKGSVLVYSLGNLLFYMPKKLLRSHPMINYGYTVEVDIVRTGIKKIAFKPYKIDRIGGTIFLKNKNLESFGRLFNYMSEKTADEQFIDEYWNFTINKLKRKTYIPYFSSALINSASEGKFYPFIKNLLLLIYRSLKMRKKLSKERARAYNYLTTKSHLMFLISTTEQHYSEQFEKETEEYYSNLKKFYDLEGM